MTVGHAITFVHDPRCHVVATHAAALYMYDYREERAGACARRRGGFGANPTQLIQLYIVGVFVSFTCSQAGMVWHITLARRSAPH